ncbi:F-box/kelch-repeat protein SKIP11-like protein [Tanacetum coccineum]
MVVADGGGVDGGGDNRQRLRRWRRCLRLRRRHFKPGICTPQNTSRMKNHSNGTLPMAKKVSKENMEINESKAGQDFVPEELRKHAIIIETRAWETLPSMLKSRKMSSGVMMHGKFYVSGGGGKDGKALSCGEEYDFEAKKWRQIPYIVAPPNELYAADCLPMKVKGCGHRVIIVGRPTRQGDSQLEIHSWHPSQGPSEWSVIGHKESNSFVPLSKGTGGKRLQVGSKFNLGNCGTKSSSSIRGEARSGYSTFMLGTEVLTLTSPNSVCCPKELLRCRPLHLANIPHNHLMLVGNDDDPEDSEDQYEVNKDAVRALLGVKQKLDG